MTVEEMAERVELAEVQARELSKVYDSMWETPLWGGPLWEKVREALDHACFDVWAWGNRLALKKMGKQSRPYYFPFDVDGKYLWAEGYGTDHV